MLQYLWASFNDSVYTPLNKLKVFLAMKDYFEVKGSLVFPKAVYWKPKVYQFHNKIFLQSDLRD